MKPRPVYRGAKLVRSRPEPKPKPKPVPTARAVPKPAAAPKPTQRPRTVRATPSVARSTAAAAPTSLASQGNSGSRLALWALLAMVAAGGAMVAVSMTPRRVLASRSMVRPLAERRLDIGISGAMIVAVILVLLALGHH